MSLLALLPIAFVILSAWQTGWSTLLELVWRPRVAELAANIHDKNFAPSEAVIRYLDGDYVVVRPGSFVRCAVTGKPIPVDELMYWNVDRQEPYADADAALEAYKRHGLSGK